MLTAELTQTILYGRQRKPRQPAEPRGHCDACGKVGLGNTYVAKYVAEPFRYRQCKFCDGITKV